MLLLAKEVSDVWLAFNTLAWLLVVALAARRVWRERRP